MHQELFAHNGTDMVMPQGAAQEVKGVAIPPNPASGLPSPSKPDSCDGAIPPLTTSLCWISFSLVHIIYNG
ncbi:hypothetical protein DAI22_12g192700 [Oryza sativa Japonica Group]|nr:hypothetical protein DAI22_12g192700 [Oryza sativa Japonica Group]